MSRVGKAWALGVAACVGLGVSFVYPPAGVIIGVVATQMCFAVLLQLNAGAIELPFRITALVAGGALYVASGSWALALALTGTYWLSVPGAILLNHARLVPPLAAAVGLVFLALGWTSQWWWALAPMVPILVTLVITPGFVKSYRADHALRRKASLSAGDPLPDFSLPRRDGEGHFRLSEHRGRFVLLCFVRGDWCPICHVLMRIIAKQAGMLQKHDVKVVLISPTRDPMDPELGLRLGVGGELYLDEDAALARSLGLLQSQQLEGKDVPMPIAMLVGRDGEVLHLGRPEDVTTFQREDRLAAVLSAAAPAAR
jgi:peroxiredoxin